MGVSEQAREFSVTTGKKEVVAAALPLQEHWLPLSNLDLLLPPVDVSVCFCYKKPFDSKTPTFISMVNTLKKGLAEVLVSFYAFSAEIVTNPIGEPELLCNNHGVDFVEAAAATVDLRELNLYDPDESIAKFVPKKNHGVLAIQATELKCGSIVVGCTFDHRIADAYSANMFLVSWAQRSRSDEPLSLLPSFRRSLLNPRRPLLIDPSLDQMYVTLSSLPPPKETSDDQDVLSSRIYYVEAHVLDELQMLASNSSRCKRSKLVSFSALLWKLVAKQARRDSDKVITSKMGVVVDGRKRLIVDQNYESDHKINESRSTMETYFGNVLSIPLGDERIDDLIENSLSWVADKVHKFLKTAITKDHFLSLIDWVENRRPKPAVSKIYSTGSEDGPAFVVSSGRGFPVTRVDFGWGPPVFGSYHFPWGGSTGYVMPMPSAAGNGDWVVYLHLTKGQLKLIEKEASHVFKPMNSDYLKIN